MALEVLHSQKEAAIFELPKVEHVEHVRMLDARSANRLLLESADDLGFRGVLGTKYLERHPLLDEAVLSQVDHPHAALANDVQEAVLPSYDIADFDWFISIHWAVGNPWGSGCGSRRRDAARGR
ncbi:MAG: hypothetical protein QM784_34305 [Polyangiaceae bacterium]